MKTLDKKLFVILKYIVILIPLCITLVSMFNDYFYIHSYTKVISGEHNENVWQYIDNKYDEAYGGDIVGTWANSFDALNGFSRHFNMAMDEINGYLPQYTIQWDTTHTTNTNVFSYVYAKIIGKTDTRFTYSAYSETIMYSITSYIFFVVMVELIWALLYLFRWFIQFGYGLFEKERKL